MKKKQRKISKFKSWIRVIALVLVVTFLWQDVLWAHPDILSKETLAAKTLPTSQDTAQAFEEFTLAYIRHKINKTTDMHALTTVKNEWWPFIKNAAYELSKLGKLKLEEAPVVSGISDEAFVNEGFIKITFLNNDELVFYDPEIYEDIPRGAIDITPKREAIGDKEYLKIAFVENNKATKSNLRTINPESLESTRDTLSQSSTLDVTQGKPQGSAIVGWKIVSASIIGFVFAILFVFATPFHDNQFIVGIALIYFLTTGVLPLLTGLYIDHSLKSLRRPRKKKEKKEKEKKDTLISSFKDVENIRDLRDHDPESRGKISYYSYGLKKLFVDKTAMRRMPRLLQYVAYFHEWLHGKARIKTEALAVPFTFCGPWFVFSMLLLGVNNFSGALSTESSAFLLLLVVYNIWVPVIGEFLAKAIGTEETIAGHYVVKLPKRKKPLTDSEIDAHIMKTAHLEHREDAPDEMYDSRDWLRGSREGNNIVFIPCEDQAEDIIIYKAAYRPNIRKGSNSDRDLVKNKIQSMGKRSVRLVIADMGPRGGINKEGRRTRVEEILKEAKGFALKDNRKRIMVSMCSTKYNLTRLRDLVELYRRRLVRIRHGNIEREAVASEVTGNIGRLIRLLDWAKAVGLKSLQFMGDYMGKLDENGEGYGFEALDILRAHIESGKNPKLSLLLGRAEHRFMLAMLGHEWITDDWPTNPAYEGPAVMRSLKRLADGEQIPGIPKKMRNEDIRKAQEFEELLKLIVKSQRKDSENSEITDAEMDAERIRWYRFHPKMIELADFIAQNMNFVFSKDRHHNAYLIGDIPEHFTRKGLKFMGALSRMEDEFRHCTASGLRLHSLMREAWVAESKIKAQTDIDERIPSSLKSVDNMIAKVKEEERFNKELGRELIGGEVLNEMLLILSKARKDLDDLKNSTSRMRVEDRGEAEEVLVRQQVQSFYALLEDRLKEITRQANLIFEEVFKTKDSPFMLATDGGMELSHDTPRGKQLSRYEKGLNTVITPADFPNDIDFQVMGYVRVLRKDGSLVLLRVDSLSVTDETQVFNMILTATEELEFIKGRSTEAVTKRKLKGAEDIVKDYDDLLINISKMRRVKRVLQRAGKVINYLINVFSNAMHWLKRFIRRIKSLGLKKYEAQLRYETRSEYEEQVKRGLKMLSQKNPEHAQYGLVILGCASTIGCATKDDRLNIIDILLRNMGIGYDENMTTTATQVLEDLVSVPIEHKGYTPDMYRDVFDRVYFWVSRLGTSEDEKEYKRRVFAILTTALIRNEKFRVYLAELAEEKSDEYKTQFIQESLSMIPEITLEIDKGIRKKLEDIQKHSITLTSPYPEGVSEDKKRAIDADKQKAANALSGIAIFDTDETRSVLKYAINGLADALASKNVDGYIKRISCCAALHKVAMHTTAGVDIAIHAIDKLRDAAISGKVDTETRRFCAKALELIHEWRPDSVAGYAEKQLKNIFLSYKVRGNVRSFVEGILIRLIGKEGVIDLLWKNKKIRLLIIFWLKEKIKTILTSKKQPTDLIIEKPIDQTPSGISILPLGGVDKPGRSAFFTKIGEYGLLFDAGLDPVTGEMLDLDSLGKNRVDYIILSHSHTDHIGSLAKVAEKFPKAKILATAPTLEQAKILLHDGLTRKLKTGETVEALKARINELIDNAIVVEPNVWYKASDMIKVKFDIAGHILGACSVTVATPYFNMLYSGDVSVKEQASIKSLELPGVPIDHWIYEVLYGDKPGTQDRKKLEKTLTRVVNKAMKKGGILMMPSFAVGRTTEIAIMLEKLMKEGKISEIPIYVDGMAAGMAKLYDKYKRDHMPDYCKELVGSDGKLFFGVDNHTVEITGRNRKDVLAKLYGDKRAIVICGSGMLSGGSSVNHFFMMSREQESGNISPMEYYRKWGVPVDEGTFAKNNTIAIVGFPGIDTPARQLLQIKKSGNPGNIILKDRYNSEHRVHVDPEQIERIPFTAHSPSDDLVSAAKKINPGKIALIHASKEAKKAFRDRLLLEGFSGEVTLPRVNVLIPIDLSNAPMRREEFNNIEAKDLPMSFKERAIRNWKIKKALKKTSEAKALQIRRQKFLKGIIKDTFGKKYNAQNIAIMTFVFYKHFDGDINRMQSYLYKGIEGKGSVEEKEERKRKIYEEFEEKARVKSHPYKFFADKELYQIINTRHPHQEPIFQLGQATWGTYEMFVSSEGTIYITPEREKIKAGDREEYFTVSTDPRAKEMLFYHSRKTEHSEEVIELDCFMPEEYQTGSVFVDMEKSINVLKEALGFRMEIMKHNLSATWRFYWLGQIENAGTHIASYDILAHHWKPHIVASMGQVPSTIPDFYAKNREGELALLVEFGRYSPRVLGKKFSTGYKNLTVSMGEHELDPLKVPKSIVLDGNMRYHKKKDRKEDGSLKKSVFEAKTKKLVDEFLRCLNKENTAIPKVITVEDAFENWRISFDDKGERIVEAHKLDTFSNKKLQEVINESEKIISGRRSMPGFKRISGSSSELQRYNKEIENITEPVTGRIDTERDGLHFPFNIRLTGPPKKPHVPTKTKANIWTKDRIKLNLASIMPHMRRGLIEISKEADLKNEDIVILLDMLPEQSEKVKALLEECIIKPLKRINGNNGAINEALKRIRFADRDDIGKVKGRILNSKTLKSKNVIIITNETRLDEFTDFEESIITALDLTGLNQESPYYPYIEATFFNLMRALGVDDNLLWACYNEIPNAEKIDEATLKGMCFDDEGHPRRIVILKLIDDAEPFNPDDLDEIYRFAEELIRKA